jgi:hypothetical protein
MSLNRTEQQVFDYIQSHPEEKHYWTAKVRSVAGRIRDPHAAGIELDAELWRYYLERSQVAEPFREQVRREGVARISLRNLAEYLLRLWAPPPPKRPAATPASHDFV